RDATVTGVQTCALPILNVGSHAVVSFQHDRSHDGPIASGQKLAYRPLHVQPRGVEQRHINAACISQQQGWVAPARARRPISSIMYAARPARWLEPTRLHAPARQ